MGRLVVEGGLAVGPGASEDFALVNRRDVRILGEMRERLHSCLEGRLSELRHPLTEAATTPR